MVSIGARIVVFAVVAGATVALWLATASRAAALGWAVQPTPNPVGVNSELGGVSCASPRSCTAVGFSITPAGTEATLAELWNGTSWAIQRTPEPVGARDSSLLGVSCTSPRSCTAVGSSTNGAGSESTLAERWNGRAWSIQRTPTPNGATSSRLVALSCPSRRSCTAVGLWYHIGLPSSEVMLAERWNGTSWSIQRSPSPAGATYGQFAGVSCSRVDSCTAVGFLTNGADVEVTLAQRRDGTSWSIQPTPNPAGARGSGLDGVSCTSRSSCAAVGFSTNKAGTVGTLAELGNGANWSIQPTPKPTVAASSTLFGVSCASTVACAAVGSEAGATLSERWAGTNWAIQRTPNPAGARSSQLDAVSCGSPMSCTAVGFFTNLDGVNVTLAERYS